MDKIPIGPYKANATEDEAYNHIDEFDMAATYSPSKTRGDCLGLGARMYFAYDDQKIVFSAEKMWYINSYGNYVGQRHPTIHPDDRPMSRDHYHSTLWTLLQHYRKTGSKASLYKIKEITNNTGYIISKMARRGFSLKLWSEAIQGKKFSQFLWHWIGILSAVFVYLPIHFILGTIANFDKEVDQEDYIPAPDAPRLQDQPMWKQKIDKILYPSYALQMTGWKLYAVNGFPLLKKIHQLVFRPMIGKTNYVQQMLFGMKGIPRDKIENFQPMQGSRWSGYLNNRNDRDLKILSPILQYNNVDCDVARKLYNETQI